MKFSGSNRSGQHVKRGKKKASIDSLSKTNGKKTPITMKKRLLKIGATVFGVLIVITVAAFAYVKFAVKAPPMNETKRSNNNNAYAAPYDDNKEDDSTKPVLSGSNRVDERKDRIYTFLLFALDDGNYNTDVIMVMTFNTTKHTIDIVNIPRDTLVNVSWTVKKANSIYANMMARNSGKENAHDLAMQSTIETFSEILGFEVDFGCIINMKAFKALVDSVDGVDFDVPVNMNYHDNSAGLHITYSKGMQHLNGQQALEVMRFRRYASADIGRIDTQQSFLMAAASQILEKKESINITEIANIFFQHVKVDSKLTLGYMLWFGKEFLKMEPDGINFHVMPGNYNDSVNGDSYVTIYLDEWFEMLNEFINPFQEDISLDEVSILTRGTDGRLYATDGNRQGNTSWGSGSVNTSRPSANGSGNNSSSGNGSNSTNSSSNSNSNSGSANNSPQSNSAANNSNNAQKSDTATETDPDEVADPTPPVDGEEGDPLEETDAPADNDPAEGERNEDETASQPEENLTGEEVPGTELPAELSSEITPMSQFEEPPVANPADVPDSGTEN